MRGNVQALLKPLDPRIMIGTKLTWTGALNDKAEVVSIEADTKSFTVKWDDGRVMAEYSNQDLDLYGGDFAFVETHNV